MTKSYKEELEEAKPVFEYTRNILAVLAFLTTVVISWVFLVSFTKQLGEPASSFIKLAFIVPAIFSIFLFIRLYRLTFGMLNILSIEMRKSEWHLIRLLSDWVFIIGFFGMAAFQLVFFVSLIPPVLGMLRALAIAAPL